MRIGIDIDNVITSFDNELLKEYLKHDKELRGTGIINENAEHIRRGMFNWSEEEDNLSEAINNLRIYNSVIEETDK